MILSWFIFQLIIKINIILILFNLDMQKNSSSQWKQVEYNQASGDALWEMTRNYNCFLVKNERKTFSVDPLNLTGLNTKRDSGVANTHAIGIEHTTVDKKVRDKRTKKKAKVVRFALNVKTRKQMPKRRLVELQKDSLPSNNNAVYSAGRNITARAIVKVLQRDLTGYRHDLLPLAFRRLRRLQSFKNKNKWQNRAEAKKLKA